MAGDSYKPDSLRPNRFEGERVALALALSLLAHVLIFGAYELRRDISLPTWLHRAVPQNRVPVILVQKEEAPLEFVTVPNPSTEAPKTAKYVSNHNSVASDNSQIHVSDNPQLNGKTDMPAPEDVRPQFSKSPTGADQKNQNNQQASQEPKPASNSGDLTLGKPENGTEPEQPRPRTLKEAYEQMKNQLPQMTMKQAGGAAHHARAAAFDVKVTGFGDYDERFAETVDQNWYNLLDSQKFALDRTGKVVLLFRLNEDGSISQMRFADNSVGDLLGYVCEKAVLDGAPYERWTEDMRLKLGDHIDVIYTFGYY
ncbi:MAG TPA: hypothetical protein VNU95_03650 [Candidatus Acidoferrales bacterium]|jgi:hypothetical protein|nr:hypothetical protein [Candidatus Acidoferrales bacterium]